jgi:hypothetical protein
MSQEAPPSLLTCREQTRANILKGRAKSVLFRVLCLSSVTFAVTIMATVINILIPAIGLTSSIVDITTDILSMMRIYTKPPDYDKDIEVRHCDGGVGAGGGGGLKRGGGDHVLPFTAFAHLFQ